MKRILLIGMILALYMTSVWGLTLDDSFKFSASGVMAQRYRMRLIAENVANIVTLKTNTGLPYQEKYAVLENSPEGVRVVRVGESTAPFPKYFDPAVPQSDSDGFFYFPNVNLPDQYLDMELTQVMFDANATAFKSTKQMYQQALEMLK